MVIYKTVYNALAVRAAFTAQRVVHDAGRNATVLLENITNILPFLGRAVLKSRRTNVEQQAV